MSARFNRWFRRHFITQQEVNELIGGMMDEYNVFQHNQDNPRAEQPEWREYSMMDSDDIHVIPLRDEIEHDLTIHCPCQPTIVVDDKCKIKHRALDGRGDAP